MRLRLATNQYEYWSVPHRQFRKCIASGTWWIKRAGKWVEMKPLGFGK